MINPKAISFSNSDQSKNTITIFETSQASENIIVIFPAMGVKASYYETLAKAFMTKGFTAISCDLRGLGLSSIRPSKQSDFGYKEMLEHDYTNCINEIKRLYPSKKIQILGHSLGGQLGSLYTSKNKNDIAGLILVACCSVYYKGWGLKGYFPLLPITQSFGLIAGILGYFPGKKLGFGGLEAKTVMKDWAQQARTGKYIVRNDSFDYEKALSKLETPTLAISFDKDTFAPHAAVKNLYQKWSESNTTHLQLLKKQDTNLIYNHFNWVKQPDEIVDKVIEWMT